jgi:hypothetical protein
LCFACNNNIADAYMLVCLLHHTITTKLSAPSAPTLKIALRLLRGADAGVAASSRSNTSTAAAVAAVAGTVAATAGAAASVEPSPRTSLSPAASVPVELVNGLAPKVSTHLPHKHCCCEVPASPMFLVWLQTSTTHSLHAKGSPALHISPAVPTSCTTRLITCHCALSHTIAAPHLQGVDLKGAPPLAPCRISVSRQVSPAVADAVREKEAALPSRDQMGFRDPTGLYSAATPYWATVADAK